MPRLIILYFPQHDVITKHQPNHPHYSFPSTPSSLSSTVLQHRSTWGLVGAQVNLDSGAPVVGPKSPPVGARLFGGGPWALTKGPCLMSIIGTSYCSACWPQGWFVAHWLLSLTWPSGLKGWCDERLRTMLMSSRPLVRPRHPTWQTLSGFSRSSCS